MKTLNTLFCILLIVVIFASCEKEQSNLSSENNANSSLNSTSNLVNKCGNIAINDALKGLVAENSQVAAVLFGQTDDNGNAQFATVGAIQPNDYIYTASVGSKGMTAYLIMKEKLDIDQTIDKWFPTSQGYSQSNKITLRMLLSHTSGIEDFTLILRPDTTITPQGIVDFAYKNRGLKFDPGTFWCYSNTNFVLAGIILEKATKKTYAQLLQKHFKHIAPSLFIMDGRTFHAAAAYGTLPFNPSYPSFAGGLVGTSVDVLNAFQYIYSSSEYQNMRQWVSVPSFTTICSECLCNLYIYADVYGIGTGKYTINGLTFYGADGNMGIGFPQIFTRNNHTYLINTIPSSPPTNSLALKKHHAEVLLGAALN